MVDRGSLGAPASGRADAGAKVCGFCHGKPVGDAATWLDGTPRPPAPCPRCGVVTFSGPDVYPEDGINVCRGPRSWPPCSRCGLGAPCAYAEGELPEDTSAPVGRSLGGFEGGWKLMGDAEAGCTCLVNETVRGCPAHDKAAQEAPGKPSGAADAGAKP